jgi:hypothetical protein
MEAAHERYEQYTSWMIRLDRRSGRIESDAVWDGLSGWRKDALLFLPDPARVAAAIGELPVVTEASGATSGWWCGQDVAVFATPHAYGSEEPSAAVWVLSRTRAAGGHALAGLRRAGIRVWRELEREEVAPRLGEPPSWLLDPWGRGRLVTDHLAGAHHLAVAQHAS